MSLFKSKTPTLYEEMMATMDTIRRNEIIALKAAITSKHDHRIQVIEAEKCAELLEMMAHEANKTAEGVPKGMTSAVWTETKTTEV